MDDCVYIYDNMINSFAVCENENRIRVFYISIHYSLIYSTTKKIKLHTCYVDCDLRLSEGVELYALEMTQRPILYRLQTIYSSIFVIFNFYFFLDLVLPKFFKLKF